MSDYDEAIDALSGLNQKEFGYLLSCVRNAVSIKDSKIRNEVQLRLEQLTQGLATVYLFAIFEDFFPIDYIKRKHNDLNEFLAYRHIRHSFAHKQLGKRANLHRAEFETLVNAGKHSRLFTWHPTTDTIELHSGFAEHLRRFLINSVARLANNP